MQDFFHLIFPVIPKPGLELKIKGMSLSIYGTAKMSVNPVQVSAGVKMLGIPVSNTGYGGVPVQDTRVFQLSSSELAAFECIGDTGCSDVFSKILLNPLELNPQSSASDDVLNLEPCFCKGFQMASIATCIILLNSRWRFTEQKLLRTLPPTL